MHISNIDSSGVGLDMVTATFGPRYTWSPRRARYALFVQGLAGVANGFNSIFPSNSGVDTVANSLAVQAGGGMNVNPKAPPGPARFRCELAADGVSQLHEQR